MPPYTGLLVNEDTPRGAAKALQDVLDARRPSEFVQAFGTLLWAHATGLPGYHHLSSNTHTTILAILFGDALSLARTDSDPAPLTSSKMEAWQAALGGQRWTVELFQAMFGELPPQDARDIVYLAQRTVHAKTARKMLKASEMSKDKRVVSMVSLCRDLAKLEDSKNGKEISFKYAGQTRRNLNTRYADPGGGGILDVLDDIFRDDSLSASCVVSLQVPVLAFNGEHCLEGGMEMRSHVEWALISVFSHLPTLVNMLGYQTYPSCTKPSPYQDLCPLEYSPLHHPGFLLPANPNNDIRMIKLTGFIDADPFGTSDMRWVEVSFRLGPQDEPAPGCIFRLSKDTKNIEVYSVPLGRVVNSMYWPRKFGAWVGVLLERFVNSGELHERELKAWIDAGGAHPTQR